MTIKAYSDASYKNQKAGIGVIIKNNNDIIFQQTYLKDCTSAIEAELLALNRLLMYLVRSQENNKIKIGDRILVFSDCKNLVNAVCKERIHKKVNKGILFQCISYKKVLAKNNELNLLWIPRNGNKQADKLSRRCI